MEEYGKYIVGFGVGLLFLGDSKYPRKISKDHQKTSNIFPGRKRRFLKVKKLLTDTFLSCSKSHSPLNDNAFTFTKIQC